MASILSRWRPNQRTGIRPVQRARTHAGDGWTPRGQEHTGPGHHRDDDAAPCEGEDGRKQSDVAAMATGPRQESEQSIYRIPHAPFHPPPGNTIRLLLVDDHAMVRQGLRSLLESYEDVVIVGEGSNGRKRLSSSSSSVLHWS